MAKEIDDRLIGRCIVTIRKQRGESQKELSYQLGIDLAKLRDYEKGRTPIPASTLWHIARILDAPITSFYDKQAANNVLHVIFRIRDDEIREQLFELAQSIEVLC